MCPMSPVAAAVLSGAWWTVYPGTVSQNKPFLLKSILYLFILSTWMMPTGISNNKALQILNNIQTRMSYTFLDSPQCFSPKLHSRFFLTNSNDGLWFPIMYTPPYSKQGKTQGTSGGLCLVNIGNSKARSPLVSHFPVDNKRCHKTHVWLLNEWVCVFTLECVSESKNWED